jgi:hypothetical protein
MEPAARTPERSLQKLGRACKSTPIDQIGKQFGSANSVCCLKTEVKGQPTAGRWLPLVYVRLGELFSQLHTAIHRQVAVVNFERENA